MLSKLFISTKNLFNSTPQANTSTNDEQSNKRASKEMVTTRGQRGNHTFEKETSVEDYIVVDTPRSSRKRQRNTREDVDPISADEEEELVQTPVKKQKALPLREKDDDEPRRNKNTRAVVEIPVSSIPVDPQTIREDISQNATAEDSGRELVAEADTEESDFTEEAPLEISDSESDNGREAIEEPLKPTPSLPKKQNKSTASPKKSSTTSTLVEPKHKRFGSGEPEPEPEFFSTAVEIIQSDEESSDEDAPEEVGAQDALKSAQSKARDAAKAVEEQETAIRKKRQERDALLKNQAEAASKKRKHAAEAAEKAQKVPKMMKKQNEEEGMKMNFEFQEYGANDATPAESKPTPAAIISRSNLPDLLPDEYLQDDEEFGSPTNLELEVARTKPRKMKFTDLVEKKPKDRRKGSTTYQVSEIRSKHLAPKSSFRAKTTKESWLKGRAPNSGGGVRKVASVGFFKKK